MQADPCSDESAERLEIFKLLVEMADRVSQRRQTANSFYLSVNTLLVGGSAYLGTTAPDLFSIAIISVAGASICALWIMNILSYKTLNEAKFAVINDLETRLCEQPFHTEWDRLTASGAPKGNARHRPFHKVEVIVPWVFGGVYVVQFARAIPWYQITRYLMSIC